jgi:hypothetical protein
MDQRGGNRYRRRSEGHVEELKRKAREGSSIRSSLLAKGPYTSRLLNLPRQQCTLNLSLKLTLPHEISPRENRASSKSGTAPSPPQTISSPRRTLPPLLPSLSPSLSRLDKPKVPSNFHQSLFFTLFQPCPPTTKSRRSAAVRFPLPSSESQMRDALL